jgi:hypothetical protein
MSNDFLDRVRATDAREERARQLAMLDHEIRKAEHTYEFVEHVLSMRKRRRLRAVP